MKSATGGGTIKKTNDSVRKFKSPTTVWTFVEAMFYQTKIYSEFSRYN